MKILPFQHLQCPLDTNPLVRKDNSWVCENGHNFDVAKQGYTHLLPVQNKRSLDPGDHKEMIAARMRFLNAAYYQPIADAVNSALLSHLSETKTFSVLDAGCGEGYYLRQLAAASKEASLEILGLDISKWAVLSAAKQDARMNWIVASNAHLPVETNSVDCVLCMFGFPVYGEFARVLKTEGLFLQVDAGVEHLRELRDIIYPNKKEETKTEEKLPDGFRKIKSENVRYSLQLNTADAIADLLAMTPHLYRANAEGREKAAALNALALTVDVQLNYFLAQ